jgi:hypothetical protein
MICLRTVLQIPWNTSLQTAIMLDRDASLLFSYPERHFDYAMAIDPPIVEALLAPFHTEGKPVGTQWVTAHASR